MIDTANAKAKLQNWQVGASSKWDEKNLLTGRLAAINTTERRSEIGFGEQDTFF